MAVRFLSEEWCRAVADQLNAFPAFAAGIKGRAGRFQRWTRGTPEGDVPYWMVVADDEVSFGLGEIDDPDATVTESYETAVAISKCELDGNTAFMRGKTRVSGNLGSTLQMMPAFQEMQNALRDLDVEY